MFFLTILVTAAGLDGDSCQVKTDCDKGLACVAGVCQATGGAGAACKRGPDCAAPLRCRSNVCVDVNQATAPSAQPPAAQPQPAQPQPVYRAAPPATPQYAAPQEYSPPMPAELPGWALGGAILGFVTLVPVLALVGTSELFNHSSPVSTPLGAAGLILFAGITPVVASSGTSARVGVPGSRGAFGLRVTAWIFYGVACGGATALLAASGPGVPTGLISLVGIIGAHSLAFFAVDALISRADSKRRINNLVQNDIQIAPTVTAVATRTNQVLPAVGLVGAF